jgi:hypothetical protein
MIETSTFIPMRRRVNIRFVLSEPFIRQVKHSAVIHQLALLQSKLPRYSLDWMSGHLQAGTVVRVDRVGLARRT